MKKVRRVKESIKTGPSRPISKWKLLGEGELDNYNFDDYLEYIWSTWAERNGKKENKFHLIEGSLYQFPEYIKDKMEELDILQRDGSLSMGATVKYVLEGSVLSIGEIVEKTGISYSMLEYSLPRLEKDGKVRHYKKGVTFRELKGDRKKFNEYKEKYKKYEWISK